MKQLNLYSLLLALIFFVSTNGYAQEIKINEDSVFVNGALYCYIHDISSNHQEFSLLDKNKKEELFIIYNGALERPYVVQFRNNPNKAALYLKPNVKHSLISELYQNNIFEDGLINPTAIQNFIALHPYPTTDIIQSIGQDIKQGLSGLESTFNVDLSLKMFRNNEARNTLALKVEGDAIYNYEQKIGTFKYFETQESGPTQRVYKFYNTKGLIIAEATIVGFNNKKTSIFVAQEQQYFTLYVRSKQGQQIAQDIASWLLEKNYF